MVDSTTQDVISTMGWKGCLLLVSAAGGLGGVINAYFADHGLKGPSISHGIWCPGMFGNVLVGIVSAIVSWALYGSGAGIDIANANPRELVSLRLSALAGACLVGIAGARWLSNEVEKAILDKTVEYSAKTTLSPEQQEKLRQCDTPQKKLLVVGESRG